MVLMLVMICAAIVLIAGPTPAVAAPVNQAATTLNWKDCSGSSFKRWRDTDGASLTGFDCAALERPLNASQPDKKVRLAITRLKASGTTAGSYLGATSLF